MPASSWELGLVRFELNGGHLDDDLKTYPLESVYQTI